ncbi:hypothetical protein [Parabacteroides pacaensis]|uniref:hypothetical protein n=1 Tax=Parabacteroides pacaensis TaxID=2086575 RepID=UPI000D10E7B9|nr:hypothetical protein [Parabacteroides pacaensis]
MGKIKINEANSYLEERFKEYINNNIPDSIIKVEPRLIYLTEEQFKKASKINIKFDVLKILTLKFLIIEFESVDYIIVIGHDDINCENDDITSIDIDEAFYLTAALASNINIREGSNAYEMLNAIYEPEDPTIFQGYELDTLSIYFEPIKIFQLPEICEKPTVFKKYVGSFLMYNKELLLLPFTQKTKQAYLDVFSDLNCMNENILNSSVAYCWRYCFLDIYRCLEPKFTYPCIKQLKDKLSITHASSVIDDSLSSILNWRAKEENSMIALFESLSPSLKTEFESCRKDDGIEKIGKLIYKLRNAIVHHYSVEDNIEDAKTVEEWDSLVCLMLKSIKEIYTLYV